MKNKYFFITCLEHVGGSSLLTLSQEVQLENFEEAWESQIAMTILRDRGFDVDKLFEEAQ